MRTPEFHFIDLHEPLLPRLIDDWGQRDALLLFPTETSRFAAQRLLQKQWPFSYCSALTWESFKERVLLSDRPLLKEEKRTLAFFSSIDEECRTFFKIHNYFQSIELAHHFFTLFEECSEAGIETPDPQSLSAAGIDWLPWQEKTLELLLRMRTLYQEWISRRGYEDRIFITDRRHLDFSSCHNFEAVIIVDHLRCSRFERELVQALGENEHQVVFYYQLPETLLDRELLQVKPCSAHDFPHHPGQKVSVWTCGNTFSMYHQLFQVLDRENISHIASVHAQAPALQHFLSPACFHLPTTIPLSETSIYALFSALRDLLDALIYDPESGRTLLPLPALLDAILQPDFARLALQSASDETGLPGRERLVTLLHKLQQQDFCYVDLQRTFFSSTFADRRELKTAIDPILDLIEMMLRIHDIDQLTALIDAADGIPIRKAIRQDELDCSNIVQVFYQSLADLAAIADLGLVDSWSALFSGDSRFATPRGILRLFLDYIKSIRIRFDRSDEDRDRIEFVSLRETQTLSYPGLAFLNLTETNLPHRPAEPFLFNDQQRKVFGLVTFEETRYLEKYLFMRAALSSPQLCLFTIRNSEKDIEPSSFLEELLLELAETAITQEKVADVNYQDYSRRFFQVDPSKPLPQPIKEQASFFTIPFDARDFPDEQWSLFYYAYDRLMQEAFGYFVDYLARIPEWPEKWELGWSKPFFGKVAQHLFDSYWSYFIIDQAAYSDFTQIMTRNGRRAMEQLFSPDSDYYFSTPKNHELIYFREISLPVIEHSLHTFFRELGWRAKMTVAQVRVIPEQKYLSAGERHSQVYIPQVESGLGIDVGVQGRADLRLESTASPHYFILDYKTGTGAKKEQLVLYELFYYLIENPHLAGQVNSCFYHILEERFEQPSFSHNRKSMNKEEYLQLFRANLLRVLEEIRQYGYTPGRRQEWGENHLDDIIRRERYNPR